MKLLAIFLTTCIMLLTAVPCCAVEKSQTTQQTQLDDSYEPKNDCTAHQCSPFYVCGSCSGFTLANQLAMVFTFSPIPVQHYIYYHQTQPAQTIRYIWQPPKLS